MLGKFNIFQKKRKFVVKMGVILYYIDIGEMLWIKIMQKTFRFCESKRV